MKPFKFTLQPVRTLRQRREQETMEIYGRALLEPVLNFYWLLGGCRRQRPRYEETFPERAFLSGYDYGGIIEGGRRAVHEQVALNGQVVGHRDRAADRHAGDNGPDGNLPHPVALIHIL